MVKTDGFDVSVGFQIFKEVSVFSKMSLVFFAIFSLSNVHAATCPNLQGNWKCGLEGTMDFPIEITQQQNDAGAHEFVLFDDDFAIVTDGVARDIPVSDFQEFTGIYSASCETGGLNMSIKGDYSGLDGLVVIPLTFELNFTPVTRDDVELIEGALSLKFQGRYVTAQKEFLNGSLELKLSDEGTSFLCTKMDINEMGY